MDSMNTDILDGDDEGGALDGLSEYTRDDLVSDLVNSRPVIILINLAVALVVALAAIKALSLVLALLHLFGVLPGLRID